MSTYFVLRSIHTYSVLTQQSTADHYNGEYHCTKYYILSLFQAEGMFLCLLPVRSTLYLYNDSIKSTFLPICTLEVLSLYSVCNPEYSRGPGILQKRQKHHLANRSLCQDQRRQLLDPPIVEPRTHRPTSSDNRCLSLPF